MTARVWCSAGWSRRCLAPISIHEPRNPAAAQKGMARVDAFECVACHTTVCPPCSTDLPNGERICKPCARRDRRAAS